MSNFRVASLLIIVTVLAGCATVAPPGPPLPPDLAQRPDGKTATGWPPTLAEADARARIAKLIAPAVTDRAGWAADLYNAFTSLGIPHATETYCAAIAITEQESNFQVDPVVGGLPFIVRRELDRRAEKYGIPKLLIAAALKTHSPDKRTYDERIDALRTEKQLNALFDDMTSELPFGRQLLADYNPVRTAGPMQVGVKFAEQQVRERQYPYPMAGTVRDEVFTRRGGLYFGSAILLDYPAPYDAVVYRFADFNAGRYASRNAAFQSALTRWTGRPLAPDGDLLRYEKGEPSDTPSTVEMLLRSQAGPLRMSAPEIRRDLLLEKDAGFGQTPLYTRAFALADKTAGQTLPREMLPRIDLNSPKFTRKLTTEWFARRVEDRYRKCLARDGQ
jgi:hypothetical protein